MKGTNVIQINGQTVIEALQDYFNKTLKVESAVLVKNYKVGSLYDISPELTVTIDAENGATG